MKKKHTGPRLWPNCDRRMYSWDKEKASLKSARRLQSASRPIESLEFQLPTEEKLKAFSEYADSVWKKIEHNHKQIRTLEKLRDTLLPKLMSGEVRVGRI